MYEGMTLEVLKNQEVWTPQGSGYIRGRLLGAVTLQGSVEVSTQGKLIRLEQGYFLASDLLPDTVVQTGEGLAVVFQNHLLQESFVPSQDPVLLSEPTFLMLLDVFVAHVRPLAHQEAGIEFLCHQAADRAADMDPAAPADPSDDPVTLARTVMSERLDEPLTLAGLAAEVRISPSHLTHLFHQAGLASPMKVLAELRLVRAKQALQESDLTISQIATSLGYKDLSTFSRFFRRCTGKSPSQYRESAQWLI